MALRYLYQKNILMKIYRFLLMAISLFILSPQLVFSDEAKMKKGLDKYIKSLYTTIMETLRELKKFDAVLRMSRFSTKRKGNDKKRLSKKLCRKKVSW